MLRPGDSVREGQVLLELHSHALHGMQGEMMRSYHQLKLAESRVEAGQKLLELEGISRLELQQREQQALAARLAFELAKSELLDLGIDDGGESKRSWRKAVPIPICRCEPPRTEWSSSSMCNNTSGCRPSTPS